MNCNHCHNPLPKDAKPSQRFCRARCRSAWHRAIKHGWSITVRYQSIPDGICKGTAVLLETDGVARPDASTGVENE